jgi:hypothetical protein
MRVSASRRRGRARALQTPSDIVSVAQGHGTGIEVTPQTFFAQQTHRQVSSCCTTRSTNSHSCTTADPLSFRVYYQNQHDWIPPFPVDGGDRKDVNIDLTPHDLESPPSIPSAASPPSIPSAADVTASPVDDYLSIGSDATGFLFDDYPSIESHATRFLFGDSPPIESDATGFPVVDNPSIEASARHIGEGLRASRGIHLSGPFLPATGATFHKMEASARHIGEGLRASRGIHLSGPFLPATGATFHKMETIASYSWVGSTREPIIAVPGLYNVDLFHSLALVLSRALQTLLRSGWIVRCHTMFVLTELP